MVVDEEGDTTEAKMDSNKATFEVDDDEGIACEGTSAEVTTAGGPWDPGVWTEANNVASVTLPSGPEAGAGVGALAGVGSTINLENNLSTSLPPLFVPSGPPGSGCC